MGYWMGWETEPETSFDRELAAEIAEENALHCRLHPEKYEKKEEIKEKTAKEESDINTCSIRFGYPTMKQVREEKFWKWPIFVLDMRNGTEYARLFPDESGCNFKVVGENPYNVKIIKEEVVNGGYGGYRHIIVEAPIYAHMKHAPADTQFYKN
jgi:hypothetical protein